MGNHEYCCRCQASDFHSGQTCEKAYPESLKKAEKERANQEKERANQEKDRLILDWLYDLFL